ncbi:MAG: right-handed parallel beta-helix repeat-containing protein, partial [Planctomycetota bacterium]
MKRSAILLVSFLAFSISTYSATIHVPDDYPTIQQAIDAAAHKDTVLVDWGIYFENIIMPDGAKAITVKSELGPDLTYIEGDQTGSVVHFSHSSTSVLEGFTIRNGKNDKGGGILCYNKSKPVIRGNVITGNWAEYSGGGIFTAMSSKPIIEDNLFSNNYGDEGGGICCGGYSDPVIIHNTFQDNLAVEGGGIYSDMFSDTYIENNTFESNVASFQGGGIFAIDKATIRNNLFIENRCENYGQMYGEGGGLSCEESSSLIEGNLFYKNS